MECASQRHAVLQAVQEQCQTQSSPTVWSREQWHAAFESVFYTDTTAHGHDDLIFLVDRPNPSSSPCKSFRVVRKIPGSTLPPQLSLSGTLWHSIAWQESVLLNLVVQASYELTVTSCRQELLVKVADGNDVSGEAVSVTKQVYASPSRTHVNLEHGKAEKEPQPAYPNIHFSVENYDDVFDELVLHKPDDCFCVVLQAVFPASSSGSAKPRRFVLFSGYVVLQQIRAHLGPALTDGRAPSIPELLGRLFGSKSNSTKRPGKQVPQRHPVYMRGPGGLGLAEVAVCRALSEPIAPLQEGVEGREGTSLQCALVSLSMPVDVLAKDILAGLADTV